MREKARLEPRYAELVYDGLWFSPLEDALDAFVARSQQPRHRRGAAAPRARALLRRRPAAPSTALYDYELATYEAADRVPPRGRRRVRAAVGPVASRPWPAGRAAGVTGPR